MVYHCISTVWVGQEIGGDRPGLQLVAACLYIDTTFSSSNARVQRASPLHLTLHTAPTVSAV